jgi:hypothetical protein
MAPHFLLVVALLWGISSVYAFTAPEPVVEVDGTRRSVFGTWFSAAAALGGVVVSAPSSPAAAAVDATDSVSSLLPLLQNARRQLDTIPALIEKEQWDSVRNVLITPPLSDCWTSNAKLLKRWAQAVPDELEALELRDDAISHLRFLDMSVYNNVFNPITTMGETGASKELIRSYYEDPMNELKASKKVMDDLLALKE